MPSFFLAGFECASHVRRDGVRLDLLAATRHAELARQDYERIAAFGIRMARDGVRWHLIDTGSGAYNWDSWLPMVRAARAAGVTVIWDLCHYGVPDGLDPWSSEFVERFARYARAAARLLRAESDAVPFYCPINEMSYWAWAGGETGFIHPCGRGQGPALKRQLVRAFAAACAVIKEVDPRARFIVAEPLIHVVGGIGRAGEQVEAEAYRLMQFEAHDMLAGRVEPELGGHEAFLDIIGANFYPDNQWYMNGTTIPLGHHAYRPLSEMLDELQCRYDRPLLVSETGAEGRARPYWLYHVCAEVRRAQRAGVRIEGICLYPVLDYPGWENGRICRAGLLSMPAVDGRRHADPEFAEELRRQMALMELRTDEVERVSG